MALDFFAGCLGGATGVLAGHPLDTVKVRLQMQEGSSRLYRGTWHCFSTICRKEGVTGLYKGLTSPLASLTVINAVVFGVHGNVSKKFDDPGCIRSHFFAGSAAGLAQSVIACPSERLKLLLQLQPDTKNAAFRSPWHAAKALVKTHGYGTLSRGFIATVLRDCPAFGIYFASYEWMARGMSKDGRMESLSGPQLLLAGGGAGMLSWLFNYPADIIKTRFQANDGYRTYWECIRKTYAENGIRSFYVGLNSTLLRAFPSNAATFFTVEWTYRLMLDFNLFGVDVSSSDSDLQCFWSCSHNHAHHYQAKRHNIMMSDFWHKNSFLLPEAGSTSIDPMIHGCRFL